ncbi:hypothetical protein MAA8898_04493 [Maliponia aquimaris]|uniref:DUF2946 domain-containing protein n=1 Tax=Maliponia aquimaris TaxID=1673631 RepID=A0A238L4B0_9RHOB|nr:hypothetical protein MAA8898_04493 [Maliponia aquimaris]
MPTVDDIRFGTASPGATRSGVDLHDRRRAGRPEDCDVTDAGSARFHPGAYGYLCAARPGREGQPGVQRRQCPWAVLHRSLSGLRAEWPAKDRSPNRMIRRARSTCRPLDVDSGTRLKAPSGPSMDGVCVRTGLVLLLAWLVAAVVLPGESLAHGVAAAHDDVVMQDIVEPGEQDDTTVLPCCNYMAGCGHAVVSPGADMAVPFLLLTAQHVRPPGSPVKSVSPPPDLPPPRT